MDSLLEIGPAQKPAPADTPGDSRMIYTPVSGPQPAMARPGDRPPVISFYRATRDLTIKTGAITARRYERKWILTGLPLTELLALVRQHPAGFRPVFPRRQVNNIYFDTTDLDYYFAHVAGASRRVKVRIRWYGKFHVPTPQPLLEFKFKHGLASWKESFPVPESLLESLLQKDHRSGGWDGDGVPEPARQRLRCLQPTIGNQYDRHYFCTPGSRVRLTVDFHLGFYDTHGTNDGWRPLLYQGPDLILELKYGDAQIKEAADISSAFPFRMSRCSKYVLGIQHRVGSHLQI